MTQRPSRPRRISRTARVFVAATAVGGLAYAVPAASAAAPSTGAGAQVSAHQIATAQAAVRRSGVDGIAWYANPTTHRVIVTADRTVSRAEVARIKQAAG